MSGGGRRARPTPSSRVVQQRLPERPHPDPAKRGRNAEFSVFSRHFVGSDSTGYVASEAAGEGRTATRPGVCRRDLRRGGVVEHGAYQRRLARPDAGAAQFAARLLAAEPEIRPRRRRTAESAKARAAAMDQSANSSWEDILRLYLFAEAFGRLRSDSSRIYITDGGHIDNIGLYQLLKRQCKLIIVIDAEADPGMNFGALVDVQRFARIDKA